MSNIKLIKVIMIFVAIIASTVVVSACGKKSDTTSGSESKEQSRTDSASSGAISVEIPPMSSNGVMYGIIIDASEKSMILQSDMGTTVKFGLNKDIGISGGKEGMVIGGAVRDEYDRVFSGY